MTEYNIYGATKCAMFKAWRDSCVSYRIDEPECLIDYVIPYCTVDITELFFFVVEAYLCGQYR